MTAKYDKFSQILLDKTKLKKSKKSNRFRSSKTNMMHKIAILKRREKIKTNDTTNEY